MVKTARILVVVAAAFALLGPGPQTFAAGSIPTLERMSAEVGASGPVIHLRADGELETVHYSPQPGVWVVEMPEAAWDQGSSLLTAPELGIERAELTRVEEFGKRVTRLTVWLSGPAQLQVQARAEGLDLEFSDLPPSGGSETPALPAEVEVEDVPVTSAAPPVADPEPAPELSPPVAADQGATAGSNLYEVAAVRSGEGVVVELRGDGVLRGSSFTLPDPERLVVDLPGVVSRVEQQLYSVESVLVRRVRVAQFQSAPEPITRLVVDLYAPADHALVETASGAILTVGTQLPAMAASAFEADSPAAPAEQPGTIEIAFAETAQPEVAEAAATPAVEPVPEPAVVREEPVAKRTERNPWVADPSQLVERAPAAQVLEPSGQPETYASTEVASDEPQFTGEPITLTLKDADIKDVLRTFSALTNLNIVTDPGVSGSVTVELRNVPWDQALDLILRINNLGYVLENNVLRVAPVNKLAAEKKEAAEFVDTEEQALPLKTVVKPLSYAKASEVMALLRGDSYLLSRRGSVVVDDRTNTLIIRDTVDRVEGILRLIEQLDLPTPQVVIEARIIETRRSWGYRLGMEWGFSGVSDAEHGNTTGLTFPNHGEVNGGVDLPRAGVGVVSFTFADILDTFNLDFALSAGEEEGVLKVVSTPRITTQNLQQAMIRSGYQIPVQTIANNTVTVQYIDATLNLEVTPQITAEGTINLDVNIRKQEPELAFAVLGGQNAPIFTREAKTQLLIRDGGTAVIGGIYQINEQSQQQGVPGLSKIPILGWLFKSREENTSHDELLIFITPRIVKY